MVAHLHNPSVRRMKRSCKSSGTRASWIRTARTVGNPHAGSVRIPLSRRGGNSFLLHGDLCLGMLSCMQQAFSSRDRLRTAAARTRYATLHPRAILGTQHNSHHNRDEYAGHAANREGRSPTESLPAEHSAENHPGAGSDIRSPVATVTGYQ